MRKSTAGGSNFDDERAQGGPERVIGDADNVQKTTYVVGRGTDPSALDADARAGGGGTARRGEPERGYAATVRTGGANVGLWLVGGLAALIGIVYAFGLLG
jgi:hypothetical protein